MRESKLNKQVQKGSLNNNNKKLIVFLSFVIPLFSDKIIIFYLIFKNMDYNLIISNPIKHLCVVGYNKYYNIIVTYSYILMNNYFFK